LRVFFGEPARDLGGFLVPDPAGERFAAAADLEFLLFLFEPTLCARELGAQPPQLPVGGIQVASHGGDARTSADVGVIAVELASEVLHGLAPGLSQIFEHESKVTPRSRVR